ncbi:MAG TPA: phosphatase domain-containing protein [Allosphingosinicella sp.]|nr:phosphatase domain-containing protein [Allosphingosinicella sp.]
MNGIRRFLHAGIADLERDIDRIGDLVSAGEGHGKKVRLLAYAGYRNERLLRLKGRIVRYRKPLDAGEGTLTRLRAMMEIYNSHELPGVKVRLQAYDREVEAITDEEGYFSFELPVDLPLPGKTEWEQAILSTPETVAQKEAVDVPVLAPGTDNHWGIISDIDDTVVETGATNFVKNWRRVLAERPQDRLAVPGASTLYKMIAEDHVSPVRPFFYVSSSPWNLYGFITEFMELNSIPHGPMFLKDYGIDDNQLIRKGHDAHKLAAIETVLAFYPRLRFLLIGDNGQRDVEIYSKVVEDFGSRVAAVFIRDVDGSCRSGREGELLARIEAAGVPTFCGAGFDDAVAVVKSLDLDRPLEAAKAVVEPAKTS